MAVTGKARDIYKVLAREAEGVRPYPGIVTMESDAEELIRLARRVHRIAENECNGVPDPKRPGENKWDDADQAKADKTLHRIKCRATEIGDRYGATLARCGGDPRGFTLAFKLKSGYSNSFAGGLFGIETE